MFLYMWGRKVRAYIKALKNPSIMLGTYEVKVNTLNLKFPFLVSIRLSIRWSLSIAGRARVISSSSAFSFVLFEIHWFKSTILDLVYPPMD